MHATAQSFSSNTSLDKQEQEAAALRSTELERGMYNAHKRLSLGEYCLPRIPLDAEIVRLETPSIIRHVIPIERYLEHAETQPSLKKQFSPFGVLAAFKNSLRAYFAPNMLESNGHFYKAIGVQYFKKALLAVANRILPPWGKGPDADRTYDGLSNYHMEKSRDGFRNFLGKTVANEVLHLYGFLSCSAAVIGYGAAGVFNGKFFFVLACAAINYYCIALQRYNRERLYRAIEKNQKRKEASSEARTD